jgi:Transcription termination factor
MISRRLIRIKIFQLLFSKMAEESGSISAAETELLHSFEKTRDLYFLLLSLPLALQQAALSKIEGGLQKFHPSPEEARPNRRFVDNACIAAISDDKKRQTYVEKRGLNWVEEGAFVRKLFADILTRPYYQEYMALPETDYEKDKALVAAIFKNELEDHETLYELLEDKSLYWADDLGYVLGLILQRLSAQQEGQDFAHPDLFKSPEDKKYALSLLGHAMLHHEEYLNLIRQSAINWEVDRIAATDIALIVLGISEVISCPSIPVKVSINEMVELSKYYSTPNSKVFVNGLLDKIVQELKAQGKVKKEGRGLVE